MTLQKVIALSLPLVHDIVLYKVDIPGFWIQQ